MLHFIQVKFMTLWYPLPPPKEDPNAFGAAMARRHLAPLLRDLGSLAEGEQVPFVVLDFGGLESATASYLKRTWLYLYRSSLLRQDAALVLNDPADPLVPLLIRPFVSRLNDEVRAELALVLEQEHLVCIELLSKEGEEARGRIVGNLDAALRETLAALYRRGAASANDLHAEGVAAGKGISVNAWNNRLTDLVRLHLATRRKDGRNWLYAPIVEGLNHE